jgi:serine/threonine protein kinase
MTNSPLHGRYQLGELLGEGGMAEVHRGRDLVLGRDVAIKMFRSDLAGNQTFLERFAWAVRNAAVLNHPAIVAVYDYGEEISATGERLPFIVMEFVNGRTLKEVLANERRLIPRRALEITADICAALEFSHRHGVIHLDVKPGNVMLTQNGRVKVMDVGIARALATGATTLTLTGAAIGAEYLSPEQARGEAVDARSDVYAAGCVLFELLCGHPPFVGDSPVAVAYQHVREDPPTPSDINRDVPPDVDAIVLKALAKDPLDRYQSAQEMRAGLLWAVTGRSVDRASVPPASRASVSPASPASVPRAGTYSVPRAGPAGVPPLSAPASTAPAEYAGPNWRRQSQPPLSPGRGRRSKRRHPRQVPFATQESAVDRLVAEAVRTTVVEGRLLFNPPETMRQGAAKRVEVAIARSLDLDHVLRDRLRGPGKPEIETISTSPFMAVRLTGAAFSVSRLTPVETEEQLVAPMARWEFDVLPLRSGERQLLLSVTLRIPLPRARQSRRVCAWGLSVLWSRVDLTGRARLR